MSNSLQLFVVRHALPFMEFSRQEYWSGWPFPSPGGFPDPGMEPGSPALAGRFFSVWITREAHSSQNTFPVLHPGDLCVFLHFLETQRDSLPPPGCGLPGTPASSTGLGIELGALGRLWNQIPKLGLERAGVGCFTDGSMCLSASFYSHPGRPLAVDLFMLHLIEAIGWWETLLWDPDWDFEEKYEVELLERCLQFHFQNYSVKLFKEEMK